MLYVDIVCYKSSFTKWIISSATVLTQQIIHVRVIQIAHNLKSLWRTDDRRESCWGGEVLIYLAGFVYTDQSKASKLGYIESTVRKVKKLKGGGCERSLQMCMCANAVGELSQEQLTRVRHQELNTSRTALKLLVIARRAATRNELDLYFNG